MAVLLAEGAVLIVSEAGREREVGTDLVLILQIDARLVGAIVAVSVALQERGGIEVIVGGDQSLNELAEVGRRGGAGNAGTAVAGIQPGVRPASAQGQRVLAEGPDGR